MSSAQTVLTDRQQQIIALVADGKTHAEIGCLLFLSPHTVKFHVERIRQAYGVETTPAAVAAWVRETMGKASVPAVPESSKA